MLTSNIKTATLLLAVAGIPAAYAQASGCPDYLNYSMEYHPPFSSGRYNLSYQRPDPACRTASSSAVDAVIEEMQNVITDPDLYRLFQNSCESYI